MGRGSHQERFKARGVAAAIFLLLGAAGAEASAELPSVAPLLQQIYPEADGLGFIEVRNPSDAPLSLEDLYLTTSVDYWQLVTGEIPGLGAEELLLRFPAEATVPAGGRYIIQLGADPAAFEEAWGVLPDAIIATADALEAPAMRAPLAAPPEAPSLDPAGGVVILFGWDGSSDRVVDADLVTWGSGPTVDKSAVSADGPDEDEEATAYAADTAPAMQQPAAALERGEALTRRGDEGAEAAGGNGLDGFDETSEPWGTSFEAASPLLVEAAVESVHVAGRVTPGLRAPAVEGLTLRFISADGERLATSDASGAFALDLPANTAFSVEVEGPGILSAAFPLDTGEADLEGLEWSVDGRWLVQGAAVAGAGAPALEGLSLRVEETGASVTLGADGAFQLVFDAAGEYTLVLDGPGVVALQTTITLGEENLTDLRLEAVAGWDVSGVLLDAASSEPVSGGVVAVGGHQTTTDASGAFLLSDVPPGLATLTAEAAGYEVVEVDLDVQSDLTLTLEAQSVLTWSLTFQVSTSDGGSPDGAMIHLRGLSTGATEEGLVDGEGVTFSSLRADNYEARVLLAGYRPLTVRSVPLGADAVVSLVLVSEDRQPSLTGEESCAVSSGGAGQGGRSGGIAALLGAGLLGAALLRRR